jgi:hypothetical protein
MLNRQNLSRAGAIALSMALLLSPAIVNGFPFVFADMGGYLARPFEHTLALGRSALYGLFLAAGISLSFWPNIILQAALTVGVLHIALRAYGLGGPATLVLVTAALALISSLPWYAGQLMPDIFLPLAALGLHLLAFAPDRLNRVGTALLMLVVILGMASHMTIVALVLALLMLFTLLRLLGRRLGQYAPRLGVPLAAAAAGIALAIASNAAIGGKWALTPGGSTFLFARLVQDGIVGRYLDEHCSSEEMRLCDHRANLPTVADDWLWGNSPLGALGGWQKYEEEARRIILSSIVSYPLMHLETAAKDTAEQLVTLATGEGLGSKDNWHARSVLRQYAPGAMTAFEASRQEHDAFNFRIMNAFHVPIALTLTGMLPAFIVLYWRRNRALSLLALSGFFAILTNAAVCAIFSNPNARYQSRIAPLAVLIGLIVLMDAWKRHPASVHSRVHEQSQTRCNTLL